LNDLFKATLQELTAAGPIDLAADWQELRKLEALSEKATLTDRVSAFDCILHPAVHVRGLAFHHLTIGAEVFLAEMLAGPGLGRWQDLGIAYVLCHAAEPEAFLVPFTGHRGAFIARLKEWQRQIGLSRSELRAALEYFDAAEALQDAEDATKEMERREGLPDYGPLIESLMREYGHTAHYWTWEAPAAHIRAIADAREIANAKEEKAAKEADPKMRTNPNRRDVVAMFRYSTAARSLRDSIAGRAQK
jgi:hypothetical protein